MSPTLYDAILTRLLESDDIDDPTAALVDAACTGDDAVAAALTSNSPPPPKRELGALDRASDPTVRGVFLREIEIRAFRGIGTTAKLPLDPGPGLTLILGRNGSGKSSFAEGLEMLLTGSCRRWTKRSVDWERGWRNIHTAERPRLAATFVAEGSGPIAVSRTWASDDLADSTVAVRRGDERSESLDTLGWTRALATFRPFLSYPELGALAEEPSRLYDELEAILGLGEVSEARERLGKVRRDLEHEKKAVKQDLEALRSALEVVDDPRAAACRDALAGRRWDLERVAEVVSGSPDDAATHDVTRLRELAQITVPTSDEIANLTSDLRQAVAAEAELADADAARADALVVLLKRAVEFHAAHARPGDPCPVCGGTLDEHWSSSARARIAEVESTSTSVREARAASQRAVQALRGRIRPAPRALADLERLGLPADLGEAWHRWSAAPSDAGALAEHADTHILPLEAAAEGLRASARARLEAVEDAWRPVAQRLGGWLARARESSSHAERIRRLKSAEAWLRDAESALRSERFAPIEARSRAIWERLRQRSNVSLEAIGLEKAGKRRKVTLDVAVDGAETIALAVMSQGELNALALSLFLPRMTLPGTPFRFLVIDDPVQAMDPLKVDGLARVLDEVAKTRQVVVFTHDARLGDAVRRMEIDARILGVGRHAGSTVEIREQLDPVARQLADARALASNEEQLGRETTARLVPAFCRGAIEAACVGAIRRRRLGRGEAHGDVDQLIRSVQATNTLMALAMFDDADGGGEVLKALRNRVGDRAVDAYQQIRRGAHGDAAGIGIDTIRGAEAIAGHLAGLR